MTSLLRILNDFATILILSMVDTENQILQRKKSLINQVKFISQQMTVQNFSKWSILIYFLIGIIKLLKSHVLI